MQIDRGGWAVLTRAASPLSGKRARPRLQRDAVTPAGLANSETSRHLHHPFLFAIAERLNLTIGKQQRMGED